MGLPRNFVATPSITFPSPGRLRGYSPTNPGGPGVHRLLKSGLSTPAFMDTAHLVCDLHQGRAIANYGATTFTLKSVEVDSPVSGVPFT